ncbi:hypothetical protein [Salinimicrobium sp. HB62]|nr:hypothetical protein [Salinimicrobium sp. HB62]
MKELAKEDKDFRKEYLAAKESILTLSLVIIAASILLIILIITA